MRTKKILIAGTAAAVTFGLAGMAYATTLN